MISLALTDRKMIKPKSVISLAIALIVIIGVVWLWFFLHNPEKFPIRTVKVTGEYQQSDKAKIQEIIMPLVEQGLFSVNLKQVKQQLMTLPWTDSAVVERLWPDELLIKLSEKIPAAVWDKNALVSDKGVLFYPDVSTFPQDLPQLSGPDGAQETILTMYQDISKIISPLDLHIVQLCLTSDMLWRMRLNNGMDVMIGNKDVLLRVQRFVQVYDKVFADERQANTVDLRYASGLAVKWQDTTRDTND